jgi:hypothetical protein
METCKNVATSRNGAAVEDPNTLRDNGDDELLTDAEVETKPTVTTFVDHIRGARKSDFVNNFCAAWRTVRPRSNGIWEGLRAIIIIESALTRWKRDDLHRRVDWNGRCQTNHVVTGLHAGRCGGSGADIAWIGRRIDSGAGIVRLSCRL